MVGGRKQELSLIEGREEQREGHSWDRVKYPQGDNRDTSLKRAGHSRAGGLVHLCLFLQANLAWKVKEEKRVEGRAEPAGKKGIPFPSSLQELLPGRSTGIPGNSGICGDGQGHTKYKAGEPESQAASRNARGGTKAAPGQSAGDKREGRRKGAGRQRPGAQGSRSRRPWLPAELSPPGRGRPRASSPWQRRGC